MPPMIEEVIREYPDVEEFYTTVEHVQGLDSLVIQLDPRSGLLPNDFEEIAIKVGEGIKTHLGVRPIVQTVAHGTLPRYEAKSSRFKDLRARGNEGT